MTVTVGADPSLSLPEVRMLVAQQEELVGPLLTIGNDGKQTLLTFDIDQDPPATHAILDTDSPPPTATSLATGKIFISGQLTDVSAFRPA
jgi:hypothetical protein